MIGGASVTTASVTLHLSCGFYMVNHVTEEMMSLMWSEMSEPQRNEFEIQYGKEEAFNGMCEEIRGAEHAVAFFDGISLACLMWADWREHEGLGRVRTLGCVCSRYAQRHTLAFVRHSKECRDAFMLTEPPEVSELYVFITASFSCSRKWAVRVCGLKEYCTATANGESFVCYRYRIGED